MPISIVYHDFGMSWLLRTLNQIKYLSCLQDNINGQICTSFSLLKDKNALASGRCFTPLSSWSGTLPLEPRLRLIVLPYEPPLLWGSYAYVNESVTVVHRAVAFNPQMNFENPTPIFSSSLITATLYCRRSHSFPGKKNEPPHFWNRRRSISQPSPLVDRGTHKLSKIGCTWGVWREPESSLDPKMTKDNFQKRGYATWDHKKFLSEISFGRTCVQCVRLGAPSLVYARYRFHIIIFCLWLSALQTFAVVSYRISYLRSSR